jgi:hypothetical protein
MTVRRVRYKRMRRISGLRNGNGNGNSNDVYTFLGDFRMPTMIRNTLAVVVGIVLAAVVNGGLISLSPSLIPPPAGVDVNSAESLKNSIHLFEPRHFIMPFFAHALGTLVGALVAYLIAASHKMRLAYVIGGVFCVVEWRRAI